MLLRSAVFIIGTLGHLDGPYTPRLAAGRSGRRESKSSPFLADGGKNDPHRANRPSRSRSRRNLVRTDGSVSATRSWTGGPRLRRIEKWGVALKRLKVKRFEKELSL